MSGVDLPDGRRIRKGAPDAIIKFVQDNQGSVPDELSALVDSVASKGATPLVVADGARIAGVVVLEDILKPHMRERFERLRKMGLRTVMITGDNPLTAATIAERAGVDDFLAQATPETKLAYIRKEQAGGKLVAMMGDGTNDAPALAQADVALAMNAGTQAAKEAANMVDLDSDPTKLIEVVEIGKQLLMTRGVTDDLLHRQRRGEILCHHSGAFCGHFAVAEGDRHHAPAFADLGHPVGGDLQCDHHPAAHPGRAQGGPLPAARRRCPAAQEHADLGTGRRDFALHRHQTDRPDHGGFASGQLTLQYPRRHRHVAISFQKHLTFVIRGGHLLRRLSAGAMGGRTGLLSLPGQRQHAARARTASRWDRKLIAQPFTKDEYFQPRPSAASYDASASASSSLAASNYALRDRVARTLGPIVKYQSGPKAGQPVAPDIESWFQKDMFQGKPHIVAQWADLHNSLAQAWVKADPTHAAYVDDWAKAHPDVVAQWIKDNPATPQPKAPDLAVVFFKNFSKENPGKFPSAVTHKGADGKDR